ncbi:highly divergent homeobox [Phyllopteryx taeniolatus]|uniref:highly divergent homeobox n=1 Tax=Phyllopteryx taeniolatus TaxID=161469 RepID=UPI002AD3EA80|nr:highly divergent homeobox [Phyllopteryx taeniolatus]XP_061644343.1 highly divergent homeobox [Phyllopteryx taeniolatus]XP_061644344.1 highly divergent homeobox [Phyllopteryx taeniolatus]
MAAPFPSSSSMDSWPQRRGLQTMNLRSVFTVEQQMILERYYDNGMTNQSKACFQLILQCAQEAKLDFSVVRTWVGNKRRKLASKGDQNGGMSHPLPSHGLAGELLSNHTLAGGALSNHGLSVAALLPAEITAVRNIHTRAHLLPTSTSFPSFSSSSSSASSPSPLRSGNNNNNNNDVIHTSIYSNPRLEPKPTGPLRSESDLSALPPCSLISQAVQRRTNSRSSSLHSKLVSLSQNLPSLTSASASLVYTAGRDMKTSLSLKDVGLPGGVRGLPPSWTRPFGTAQTQPWSACPQSQAQLQPRAETNPQQPPAAPHKTRLSLPLQNLNPTSEQKSCIQQVFTLVERGEGSRIKPGLGSTLKGPEMQRPVSRTLDTSHNFSIAMETADEEDEWQREEELANMAAQNNMHQEQTSSLVIGSHSMSTTCSQNLLLDSNLTHQGSSSFTQTSLSGEASSQTPVSAATWVISNSRKRTLQDRTQFSDEDIIQLKRYWDRGMTSLGSVCREKITAAANQLNVDTEIVKTWISNRRRKYRLMSIEIPPPQGGPAVFTNTSSPRGESPVAFSPEDRLRTPELRDDLNDGVSLCLSEDSTIDSHHRDENGTDVTGAAPLANNVKIEVIDGDEEEDDNEGEIVPLDLEQMQSLLEFKHEEVQFLENELENQKQKYLDLASFTKRLLSAVRNKDVEKQQELIASLPQPSDQVWDMTKDRGTLPDVVSEDKSSNYHITMTTSSVEHMQELANDGSPLMNIKEDSCIKVIGPSASEEQMQGVQEHE